MVVVWFGSLTGSWLGSGDRPPLATALGSLLTALFGSLVAVGRVSPVELVAVCAARGEIPMHRARANTAFGHEPPAAWCRFEFESFPETIRVAFIVSPFNLVFAWPL